MNEHEVIVLLHIAEANGLYHHRHEQVVITASLGGTTLASDHVRPGQTTVFDINLVWESDKKVIKRMKSENLPIKLECYSVDGRPQSARRQLIGFVMIPIRGVPMNASVGKPSTLVPRWHKFNGLAPEWKALKPSISLCTSIMDSAHVQAANTAKRNANSWHAIETANMLCSQQGMFVSMLPDKNYIQLGSNANDCLMFVVHLELRALCGLLPAVGAADDQFHMQYVLFGTPSETRPLIATTVAGRYSIKEKITIQFRASNESLREYFANIFYIPIDICDRTGAAVGRAKFSVTIPPQPDGWDHRDDTICRIVDRCALTTSDLDGTESPCIDYEFVIRYLQQPEPSSVRLLPLASEPISEGGSDATSFASDPVDSTPAVDFVSPRDLTVAVDFVAPSDSTPLSQDDIVEPVDTYRSPYHRPERDVPKSSASPALVAWPTAARITAHTFSYLLHLQKVRFTRKTDDEIWQVCLNHPKAHTPISLVNVSVRASDDSSTTTIDNVSVELLFSCDPAGIRGVIASEPCVLSIKGPHAMIATAELDNATLLAQPQGNVGVVLMENEACEWVALASAYVELTDLGANLNAREPKFRRVAQPTIAHGGSGDCGLKPHLDEELAFKMVEELEQWKTAQQKDFLMDLKQRETQHLARLTAEWTLRRGELELLLTQKLEQCSVLTRALETANRNLQKDKHQDDLDRKRLLDQAKIELEKSCKRRLQQLQEHARRCEDDAAYDAKLAELRYKELQLQFDKLQLEHSQCTPRSTFRKDDGAHHCHSNRSHAADMESNMDEGETPDFSITRLIATERVALQQEQEELQTINKSLERTAEIRN